MKFNLPVFFLLLSVLLWSFSKTALRKPTPGTAPHPPPLGASRAWGRPCVLAMASQPVPRESWGGGAAPLKGEQLGEKRPRFSPAPGRSHLLPLSLHCLFCDMVLPGQAMGFVPAVHLLSGHTCVDSILGHTPFKGQALGRNTNEN